MGGKEGFIDSHPFSRVFHSVYTFFSAIPKGVNEVNYWFYNVSNLAYVLIALVHASWIIVFYHFDLLPMMWLQFVSILCYVAAIIFNRKGYHSTGMLIGVVEAVLHQIAAVAFLGWGTGFQNFIPLIALLPFLKYNETWITKFSFGLGCAICYLYIDFFMKGLTPVLVMSPLADNFINFSNVILCFILVSLWGIVLAYSYQQSVAALMKKEQELFAVEKAAEQSEILSQLEMKERNNEIFHLRNIELKKSNDEILAQKQIIDVLVLEQEEIIKLRTVELADTNKKLVYSNKRLLDLVQYNAHTLREPLTRIIGGVIIIEYMDYEEYCKDILPEIGRAATDLDVRIRRVIDLADRAASRYS